MEIQTVGRLLLEYLETPADHRRIDITRQRLQQMFAACAVLTYAIGRELWAPEAQTVREVYEPYAPDAIPTRAALVIGDVAQSYTVRTTEPTSRTRRFGTDPAMTSGELRPQCIHRKCHDKVRQVRALLAEDPTITKIQLIEQVLGGRTPSGEWKPTQKYGNLNQLLMHKCTLALNRDLKGRIMKENGNA